MITPRDFDLSPYFEIVKFNHLADPRFDYRSIVWDGDEAAAMGANGNGHGSNGNGAGPHADEPPPSHLTEPRARPAASLRR